MFIISLHYIASLEDIDAIMKLHVAYLKKYYSSGHFIASGRKTPRTGGIILANAKSKAALEKIVKEDPFVKNKLANFEITEFNVSMKADDIGSSFDNA